MIKELENLLYEERLKELGFFGLQKFQEEPHHSFPVLEGDCKEDGGFLFTRGNKYKLHGQRLNLDISNKLFCSENSQSLEQFPWGCGRVPVAGGFQDEMGQCAR